MLAFGELGIGSDQGVVGFGVFVLIFCRQRYFRGGGRNRAEDRPILQDKPDIAVFLDQLREFGRHFFAIRALIVEIFDDRQIALWNFPRTGFRDRAVRCPC